MKKGKILAFIATLCASFSFISCGLTGESGKESEIESLFSSSVVEESSSFQEETPRKVVLSFQDCHETKEQVYDLGGVITPPQPKTVAGFTFVGWTKDGELYDFENNGTAIENLSFKASYIANDKITLHDGSKPMSSLGRFGVGSGTSYAKAFAGNYSYKFEVTRYSDIYASYAIDYDVIPVGYYEYRVLIDDTSFKNADGEKVAPPDYTKVTTGYDILYAAIFDTEIGMGYTGDYGVKVKTHLYDEFAYGQWIRVLVEVIKPLNKKISLRSAPVKAVLTGEMAWSATEYTYDVYYDEVIIPKGIATHELDEATALHRKIESFLKLIPGAYGYETHKSSILTSIDGLTEKQKDYVLNLNRFLEAIK